MTIVARGTKRDMRKSLQSGSATFKYATTERARDPKIGVVFHKLCEIGYSDTPGGAAARARRELAGLQIVRATAETMGQQVWLDGFMLEFDEPRLVGADVTLDASARRTIERADAEDNCARVAYYCDPSLENAKAVLTTGRRLVLATLAAMRGVRTDHPELAQ